MSYLQGRVGDYVTFSNGRTSPERKSVGEVPVYGSNGLIGYTNESNAPAQTTIIGRVGTYCGSLHFSHSASWVTDNAIRATANEPDEARFWHYALVSADLNRLRSGSGQPLINQRSLNTVELRVPQRELRLRIGCLLGSLDDKIELNRRMNETLVAMAQAIFRDWFVDFGPTRRKIDGATDPVEIMGGLMAEPDRARELAELFSASIGDDGLPEGWGTQLFSDISHQHTATLTPAQSPLEQFAHFSLPAFDKGKNPTIELGGGILSNKTMVPLDAVLLSKLNPDIERVWLPVTDAKHRAICSTEFLVYTADGTSTREFLFCLFSDPDFRNILKGLVTGTSKSHQRVAPKALARLPLIRPPLALDKAFGALVSPLLNRALNNGGENRTLAATRDLLLPKLMSGEISLTDARAQAEEAA